MSARTVTQSTAPTSTTTLYVYDLADHLIAELNASGQTQKEYIWLDDMPVAVVDAVASGSPVIYYVHVDHLMRPIRMTAQNLNWVWDVNYAPFGQVLYLYTNPAVMNGRFPVQWFQIETGLAYNWHRHYDPTTGRYIQPDPLLSDESGATVAGIPVGTVPGTTPDGHAVARSIGWQEARDIIMGWPSPRPMLQDGPSLYGYVDGEPTSKKDPLGLAQNYTPRPPSSPNVQLCQQTPSRRECASKCADLALPTTDFGGSFQRCMAACLSGGNSGFRKWDKYFPKSSPGEWCNGPRFRN